jgi:hypothetical protein
VKSPPVAKSPSNKGSKNAFFTASKFNLNNDVKVTANPAKVAGLKVPDPYFENEQPLLKPDIQVINNPFPILEINKNPPIIPAI